MSPAQNLHQTMKRYGCICFSTITRGFSEPQIYDNFVNAIHQDKNEPYLKMILLKKSASTYYCSVIYSCVVNSSLSQLNFVSMKIQIFRKNML